MKYHDPSSPLPGRPRIRPRETLLRAPDGLLWLVDSSWPATIRGDRRDAFTITVPGRLDVARTLHADDLDAWTIIGAPAASGLPTTGQQESLFEEASC